MGAGATEDSYRVDSSRSMGLGTPLRKAPWNFMRRLGRASPGPAGRPASAGEGPGEPSSPSNRLASEERGKASPPAVPLSSPGGSPASPGPARGLSPGSAMPGPRSVCVAWPAGECERGAGQCWVGNGGSRKPPPYMGKQHHCQLLQSHRCNDRGLGRPLPDAVSLWPGAGAAIGASFRDLATPAPPAPAGAHAVGGKVARPYQTLVLEEGFLLTPQASSRAPSAAFRCTLHSLGATASLSQSWFLICKLGGIHAPREKHTPGWDAGGGEGGQLALCLVHKEQHH